MKHTCGLFIVSNNKLLITHPTNSPMNAWSIPKGLVDEGETYLQAALRELEEETGLQLTDYADDIFYLGSENYNSNRKKRLQAFVLRLDEDITKIPLICDSTFVNPKNGKEYPENDIIKWIDVDDEAEMLEHLHYTQKKFLNDVI